MHVNDVALKMNVRPSSLSRSFASETLTPKARRQAAQILGVDESVFDTGIIYKPPVPTFDVLNDAAPNNSSIMEENERLKRENARLAEELLREREMSDDLRKALLLIAGKGGG